MSFVHTENHNSNGRLGRKLLLWVLLGSVFFTVVGTIIQLSVDYRRDMTDLEDQLEQIQRSRVSSLSSSLWYLDEEQLAVQLEGLVELPGIKYAEIRTSDGMHFFRGEHDSAENVILRKYPLDYFNADRSDHIGDLFVAADKVAVHARIMDKVLVIMITQGMQVFLVAALFISIFNLLVTRHLQHMAQYASALTIQGLDYPLRLPVPRNSAKPDEIDVVVEAFNVMRENLLKDIRQREEAEARLKFAESYTRNILDSMPSIIVSVDMAGLITHWNRSAVYWSGIPSAQAIGHSYEEICPGAPVSQRQIEQAMSVNRPLKMSTVEEKDGDMVRYMDVTVFPLVTDKVHGAVVRIDDVSERVRLEEMMIQSEKMLSVGGLAAGMAHEINNPLAGILQNAQVIRNRISPELAANERIAGELGLNLLIMHEYFERRGCLRMMDAIMEAGKRAARIVENMLSFARKGNVQKEKVDLADLLDRTVELAANDYDLKKHYDFRKIRIEKEYAPNLPAVPCEESKVQQVFFNLIRNGAQAMFEDSSKDACLTFRVYPKDGYLCVEIEDNGPGMPEEMRKRVFEPFFTTKQVGKGTGLGLSVSYFIIVENHGGRLEVESTRGKGTIFTIRLPIRSEAAGPAIPANGEGGA